MRVQRIRSRRRVAAPDALKNNKRVRPEGFVHHLWIHKLTAILLQRGVVQTNARIHDVVTTERPIEARTRGVQSVLSPVQTVLQRRKQILGPTVFPLLHRPALQTLERGDCPVFRHHRRRHCERVH